jgi:hypothetical protein
VVLEIQKKPNAQLVKELLINPDFLYFWGAAKQLQIPVLFDHKFEITQHFPSDTEVFHISAVRGFYYLTGRYFARTGKIELAYNSFFQLSDLDIDHKATEILGQEIMTYEVKELEKKMRKR